MNYLKQSGYSKTLIELQKESKFVTEETDNK